MTATPGSDNVRGLQERGWKTSSFEVPVVLKPHTSGFLRTLFPVLLRPARIIFRPRPQARFACAVWVYDLVPLAFWLVVLDVSSLSLARIPGIS